MQQIKIITATIAVANNPGTDEMTCFVSVSEGRGVEALGVLCEGVAAQCANMLIEDENLTVDQVLAAALNIISSRIETINSIG